MVQASCSVDPYLRKNIVIKNDGHKAVHKDGVYCDNNPTLSEIDVIALNNNIRRCESFKYRCRSFA